MRSGASQGGAGRFRAGSVQAGIPGLLRGQQEANPPKPRELRIFWAVESVTAAAQTPEELEPQSKTALMNTTRVHYNTKFKRSKICRSNLESKPCDEDNMLCC